MGFKRMMAVAVCSVLVWATAGGSAAAAKPDEIYLGKRCGSIATHGPSFSFCDKQYRGTSLPDWRTHVIEGKFENCDVAFLKATLRASVLKPGGGGPSTVKDVANNQYCPRLHLVVSGSMDAEVSLSVITEPGPLSYGTVIAPV